MPGPTIHLIDKFTGTTLSSLWSTTNPAQISTPGFLQISNAISGTTYGVVQSVANYDFTGSSISARLISAGNQALASWQAQPVFIAVDGTNCVNWYVGANQIHAQKEVAGVFSDVATLAYNATAHKWFRVRHSGTTIYWDYSADGRTWKNLTTLANPFASITAVFPTIQAGTFNAEASQTSMQVDSFNFFDSGNTMKSIRPHPFSPGLAR